MEGLRAYRASAGTGKTTKVCEEIVDALAHPDEPIPASTILATTFTKAAAAELKSRIRERILSEKRLERAERLRLAQELEFAAIGTVHSIGRQLLQRYAFRLGLSPRLQVLDEDAAPRHLEEVVNGMPASRWQELANIGRRLDPDDPRKTTLNLFAEKRTNQISDEDFVGQIEGSAQQLCELLAPDGPDPDAPDPEQLATLAQDALTAITALDTATKKTDKAVDRLERLSRTTSPYWKNIVKAGKLSAGKRSGADDCLDDLRTFARQVRQMPALHEDVIAYSEALAKQVLRVGQAYESYKRVRGLLDFTDLEVHLLNALDDDRIHADVAASFEFVLVDEFQDSNPIQLAIFLRLHEIAGRSCWVGDAKQSIYAFRDADLELAEASWGLVDAEQLNTLPTNYRSHEGLVDFQNELFVPVFGESARVEAQREEVPVGIERWWLSAGNKAEDHRALAEGVRQLIDKGHSADDITVLVRTNRDAAGQASALEAAGIAAVVERPGLLRTYECRLAQAGLGVVADSFDSLAAAHVVHLTRENSENTPSWLAERLGHLSANEASCSGDPPWPEHADVSALRDLEARSLGPAEALELVIQTLDLPARLAPQGRPRRRAANLDAFVDLAYRYEDQTDEEGRASTPHGFLEWLEEIAEEKKDLFPTPHGVGTVTVTTYHKAKGLEWPVVVMTGLQKSYSPDMWSPETRGGKAEEGRPLEERTLRYWLWPFGTDWTRWGERRVTGSGLDDDALSSPEGMRQRERLREEERRLLYVGMTRASDKLVLAHRGSPDNPSGHTDWLDLLPHHDVLDPSLEEGEHDLQDLRTTLRVRELAPSETPPPPPDSVSALDEASPGGLRNVPLIRRPHEASRSSVTAEGDVEKLPGEFPFSDGWQPIDRRLFGQAAHAYLAGLPAIRKTSADRKRQLASVCLKRPDGSSLGGPRELVAVGDRLIAWLEKRYPEYEWLTEVPVVAPRDDEGLWSGAVDLLLVDENDQAVIVDHKIVSVEPDRRPEKALEFRGQLWAYRRALEQQELTVRASWIHLPLGDGIVKLRNK